MDTAGEDPPPPEEAQDPMDRIVTPDEHLTSDRLPIPAGGLLSSIPEETVENESVEPPTNVEMREVARSTWLQLRPE